MTIVQRTEELLDGYVPSMAQNITNTEFFRLYLDQVENINTQNISIAKYVELVHKGELPTFEGISRALRKARELNPKWQKDTARKRLEQNYMEAVIGY